MNQPVVLFESKTSVEKMTVIRRIKWHPGSPDLEFFVYGIGPRGGGHAYPYTAFSVRDIEQALAKFYELTKETMRPILRKEE